MLPTLAHSTSIENELPLQDPLTNVPLASWPAPATKQETLYLSADLKATKEPSTSVNHLSYQSDVAAQQMDEDLEELCFSYTFQRKTTILGCVRAVLYMSTPDHDDMDVFVQLRKADSSGRILQNINIPKDDREAAGMVEVEPINPLIYLGPTGALRASYREIDKSLSNDYWPEHTYAKSEKLAAGEVVKLEIGLWQTGIQFEAGEQLVVKVAGHPMALAEFPPLRGAIPNANKGRHLLHVGGDVASYVVIPTVDV